MFQRGLLLFLHFPINFPHTPRQVLKMLSAAMGLHMMAAILMLAHLWRYSVNGEGIPVFETLSEG